MTLGSYNSTISKRIFLLTDGDVSSPSSVIELAGSSSERNASIHSFGLGNGCNKDLIMKTAQAGRGSYYFAYENDSLKAKFISALGKACQPSMKNCKISNSVHPILESEEGILLGEVFRNQLVRYLTIIKKSDLASLKVQFTSEEDP